MKGFEIKPKNCIHDGKKSKMGWFSFQMMLSILIFSISLAIFSIILIKDHNTDLDGHIRLLELHLNIGKFPVPPLYYSFLYLMKQVLFTNYKINVTLLLSLTVLWKFNIALEYIKDQQRPILEPQWMISLVLFGLMFFFPIFVAGIDGPKLYLGKFTPTIWHNSTTIFAFPLSVLLFLKSIKYIDFPSEKNLIYLFLLGFLILISKPSFLFAFVPIFPFMYVLRRNIIDIHFSKLVIFCLFIFCGIGFLAWWIYDNGQIDKLFYGGEKTQILLAPFEVWLIWTKTPFLDLISSFLFAILFFCFYYKRLLKDWHFKYALLVFLLALFIFWLFAESGERFAHGNFYWQVPICLFIVYLVMIKNWIQMLEFKVSVTETLKRLSRRNRALLGFFSLHVFSGGIYLFKLLYFGSFS